MTGASLSRDGTRGRSAPRLIARTVALLARASARTAASPSVQQDEKLGGSDATGSAATVTSIALPADESTLPIGAPAGHPSTASATAPELQEP
jgi:hypothetical protein